MSHGKERSSQTVPTALLPLPERPVPWHNLGSMTLQCPICSALHWEFEKSPTPGGATPFKICCADGKFRVPAELLALLTGDGPDYKGHGIISGSGPPSFYLSGMAFHRIGTLAPAPANDPVFAQILFLAPTERIEARRRFNGPPEEVRRLDSAYQQIHKNIMDSDASHMYQLCLLAPRNRDPRTYNLPTQDEVAVILPGRQSLFLKIGNRSHLRVE
ncbi:BQ5605_C004g02721 [Microbotryum silenes-dioicae]|uniref:BQ5605_C004g02721 protein n=1 Tax=Microbotryum silenes-dioicae TaxID=796604 RepID=A0A2X0P463_9BASI|nr:BQ5605_C004g02721 [Microbotryum silenes-dioicae]